MYGIKSGWVNSQVLLFEITLWIHTVRGSICLFNISGGFSRKLLPQDNEQEKVFYQSPAQQQNNNINTFSQNRQAQNGPDDT